MEISKMLTISTAHITEQTAEFLSTNVITVPHYEYEYGYFIYIPEYDMNLPQDLMDCMLFAKANGCEWLRLDCDGYYVDELERYDW